MNFFQLEILPVLVFKSLDPDLVRIETNADPQDHNTAFA
jgi:hypothetical protein